MTPRETFIHRAATDLHGWLAVLGAYRRAHRKMSESGEHDESDCRRAGGDAAAAEACRRNIKADPSSLADICGNVDVRDMFEPFGPLRKPRWKFWASSHGELPDADVKCGILLAAKCGEFDPANVVGERSWIKELPNGLIMDYGTHELIHCPVNLRGERPAPSKQ